MLIPLIFAIFLVASGDGFLIESQHKLGELSGQMVELLSSKHKANSKMVRNFIETDILPYLGNATVQLQSVYKEVGSKMKDLRSDPDADHRCLDSIDASIYDEVLTGQVWLQLCVSGVDFFLTRDPVVRFFPVANVYHESSSTMPRLALTLLGYLNPVLDGTGYLRETLDEYVDFFGKNLGYAERQLTEELDKHEDAREEVIESFQECVESLYYYFQVQLYNLLGFARDTCLIENKVD